MTPLTFVPLLTRTDLVTPAMLALARTLPDADLQVAEIDPAYTSAPDVEMHYGIPPSQGANCVIVQAEIAGADPVIAAILAPAHLRLDLNGAVRRTLGARRISFADLAHIQNETNQEVGSITPFGLPPEWPILVDSALTTMDRILVGGGLRRSKLFLPTSVLLHLPSVRVVEGLTRPPAPPAAGI